ncbi:hypothetical protein V492_05315 [Pseudogymnoascus sp. VKM F-4246]|nr:hypothetical protein V492_05315 [Pseudogymnoascus sp. VKM F-4246]
MKTNVLSTLGVLTTFCQPVSSCVYGTSLLPFAEGSLKGSQFGYTDPIGPFRWSQMASNSDASGVVTVGATTDVLEFGAIGTATKSNPLRQADVNILTEHTIVGEYFSMEGHPDFNTAVAAVAFLTYFDKTYTTQDFGNARFPVAHMASLDQIATTIVERFSSASPIAMPSNNRAARCSSFRTAPSCSEGVDRITSVTPAEGTMRFNARYIQRKAAKPNHLLQAPPLVPLRW